MTPRHPDWRLADRASATALLWLAVVAFVALASAASGQGTVSGPVRITDPLPTLGAEHPADVTVTVHYVGNNGDPATLTVDGMRLHGVVWYDRRESYSPWLDLDADGTGNGPEIRPIRSLVNRFGRDATWSATVTPSDAPGVCELAPDEYGDSAPALNWCIQQARANRRPGTLDTLRIGAGVYAFAGPVLWPDSIHIQGAGGAILTEARDEFGHTYAPVLPASEFGLPTTTFRQLDRTAFTFLGEAMGDELTEAERVRIALRQDKTAWLHEPGAALVSISDVRLDGNGESDLARLMRAKASPDPAVQKALMDGLQNSPSHTGLSVTIHGATDPGSAVLERHDPRAEAYRDDIPAPRTWDTPDDGYPDGDGWRTLRARHTRMIPGTIARVKGVSITGFAATGILGDYRAHFDLNTVHTGDCLWNHSIYKADGRWRNVTFSGYSWHHAVLQGTDLGTVENLVIHRQAPNPSGRDTGAALDVRLDNGEDAFLRGVYADLRGMPGGRLADIAPRYYNPDIYEGTPFPKPDDVALHLRDATVITDGSRLASLRRTGPVTIDTLRVHTPDPERFTLAYPADNTGMLSVSAVTVSDTTATTTPTAPVIPDPPVTGPPITDCSDAEAEAARLRLEVKALSARIEILSARNAHLARQLEATQAAFEASQARAQAAVRILSQQ